MAVEEMKPGEVEIESPLCQLMMMALRSHVVWKHLEKEGHAAAAFAGNTDGVTSKKLLRSMDNFTT